MKTDLETLKTTLKVSSETFEESALEAKVVTDYFHNRQLPQDTVAHLENIGQPKETFNLIRALGRLVVGYYSTVVNTIKISPRQQSDHTIAGILTDIVDYTLEQNSFEQVGDDVKLDALISGLMCVYLDIKPTGKTDMFGKDVMSISIEHVPVDEIYLDPLSTKSDYSDARYIHRAKWITKEELIDLLIQHGRSKKQATADVADINANEDMPELSSYTWEDDITRYVYNNQEESFKQFRVIHTIIVNDKGGYDSILWCKDKIIHETSLENNYGGMPYKVVRVNRSNRPEYYGLFRDVIQSQDAINQAIIKLQLLVNTSKVFVTDNAVADLEEFTRLYNRVSAVVPVQQLDGILIHSNNPDIQQQMLIIDRALERVKFMLGINDAFLGMAFAADSGRKVKLQQSTTELALNTYTNAIKLLYKQLGIGIVSLVRKYYTANMVFKIADEALGDRWLEINKPITAPEVDPSTGGVKQVPFMKPSVDEEGLPQVDEEGNTVIEPINEPETEIKFDEVDIKIESKPYNDEKENSLMFLESILNSAVGNVIAGISQGNFLKIASLNIRNSPAREAPQVADMISRLADNLLAIEEQQFQQTGVMVNQQSMATGEEPDQANFNRGTNPAQFDIGEGRG